MSSYTVEEGLRDLLVNAGVGAFNANTGWSIIIGTLVDTGPDTVICINQTGGKAPNPKYNIDYPSAQVRVRGISSGWIAARQKARDVKDALLGLPSQTINGDRWDAINMIGDITPMGIDANGRPSFVVNFSLIIEPAVTGNRLTGE